MRSTGLSKFKNTARIAGFSLLEVSVSAAIILVMVTLLLFNYQSLNGTTLLENQALEVALGIREVQMFALNSRGTVGTTEFREEFGLYIDRSTPGSEQEYIVFRDNGGNGGDSEPAQYNTDEELSVSTLDNRFFFSDICYVVQVDGPQCGRDTVHLSFKRPNFDAVFYPDELNVGGTDRAVEAVTIDISLVTNPTISRTIRILRSGVINVQ